MLKRELNYYKQEIEEIESQLPKAKPVPDPSQMSLLPPSGPTFTTTQAEPTPYSFFDYYNYDTRRAPNE